jgi:hypothetical protein
MSVDRDEVREAMRDPLSREGCERGVRAARVREMTTEDLVGGQPATPGSNPPLCGCGRGHVSRASSLSTSCDDAERGQDANTREGAASTVTSSDTPDSRAGSPTYSNPVGHGRAPQQTVYVLMGQDSSPVSLLTNWLISCHGSAEDAETARKNWLENMGRRYHAYVVQMEVA